MNTIRITTIVLGTMFMAAPHFSEFCQAQSNNFDLYQMYEKTLEKYSSEKFDEAIELSKQIREKYPLEPSGAFGLLTTYQTISCNYRIRKYDGKIDSLLELSVQLAEQAVKRDRKNGLNYFYLGCAYGFKSIERARKRKWMEAFKYGAQVSKSFSQAIAYSPDLYDAYYGLGLYKYWLAARGAMRYLPFAKKNRREGLEHMMIAKEKARFTNIEATYGLMAAYMNEEEFEQALVISNELLQIFPNNPGLYYRRGRIFQSLERWKEAIAAFEKLRELLVRTPYQSISYQIDCLYQLAKSHHALQNIYDARRYCEAAMALTDKLDFSKEIDGPLDNFEDIQKALADLHNEIKSVTVVDRAD